MLIRVRKADCTTVRVCNWCFSFIHIINLCKVKWCVCVTRLYYCTLLILDSLLQRSQCSHPSVNLAEWRESNPGQLRASLVKGELVARGKRSKGTWCSGEGGLRALRTESMQEYLTCISYRLCSVLWQTLCSSLLLKVTLFQSMLHTV